MMNTVPVVTSMLMTTYLPMYDDSWRKSSGRMHMKRDRLGRKTKRQCPVPIPITVPS